MSTGPSIQTTFGSYSFRCIITDGLSYIDVQSDSWSSQAKWVGAEFVITFPAKTESRCVITKVDNEGSAVPTFHVDDLGNHAPLKRAVLKAAHKGWPVYVDHTFIYLEPPF